MQSRIIEIFQSLIGDGLNLNNDTHSKELGVIIKAEKQLLDAVGENEELIRLVENFEMALEECHIVECEQCYKAGFKDGAKVMKEICE